MKRLLPTKKDDEELHNNFKILLSRILANHIEIFKFGFSDVVSWHITHKYSQQMSEKSKVVSKFLRLIPVMIFSFNIGILLKNENKTDEMIEVMNYSHKSMSQSVFLRKNAK